MTDIEYIAAEQVGYWKREGWLAKQCLVALGRHHDGSWTEVFNALVREVRRMQGTPS